MVAHTLQMDEKCHRTQYLDHVEISIQAHLRHGNPVGIGITQDSARLTNTGARLLSNLVLWYVAGPVGGGNVLVVESKLIWNRIRKSPALGRSILARLDI